MSELSERELNLHLGKMRLQNPYDMYELWQGCGPDLVEEKFVEMTHRYHPDHFVSQPNAKRLAQEIFMLIVQARGTLRRQEKRQIVAAPPAPEQQEVRDEGFRRLASRPRIPNPRSLDALSQASEAYESLQQDSAPSAIPVSPTPTPATTSAASESEDSEAARQARLLALQSRRRPKRLTQYRTNPGAGDTLSQPSDVNMSEAERQQRLQALARKRPGAPAQFVEAMRQSSVASSASDVLSSATSDELLQSSSSPSLLPISGIRPESYSHLDPDSIGDLSAREAFNYGYREYKVQRYESALHALKHAYDLEPDNGLYMTFYGYTLFQVAPGELPSAEKVLRKAVEAGDPQSLPDAHLFLGLILKKRGGKRMNEAMRHFQTAFELNPTSREAEREIRLHEVRMKKKKEEADDSRGFFQRLFKK